MNKFKTVKEYFDYFQSLSVDEQFKFCENKHSDMIIESDEKSSQMIHYHNCTIEEYDKQVGAVPPEQLLGDISKWTKQTGN